MAMQPLGPVVVGVDGSESSMLALDLAAEEAAARATALTVLHAYDGGRDALAAAHRIVAVAAGRAGAEHPMVSVRGVVDAGDPAEVLAREAREACLLVLGSPGGHRGPWRNTSVTRRVLGHATVPVLIHRPFDTPVEHSPREPIMTSAAVYYTRPTKLEETVMKPNPTCSARAAHRTMLIGSSSSLER